MRTRPARASAASRAFRAVPRPDPLEPPGGLAAAAVADAGRAVVRRRGLAGLAPAHRVRAGHHPHAQRRLLRQRRGRPRLRPPRQANRPAAGDQRRRLGQGGAGGGRGAGAGGLCAGAHDQPRHGAVVFRGAGGHADLSLRQALRVDSAGGAGHRLQLRHPDGLRGRAVARCRPSRGGCWRATCSGCWPTTPSTRWSTATTICGSA